MRVIKTIAEMRAWRREVTGTVGFVPTMGAIHFGHLRLVAQARQRSDQVVVSIFVNPTQFGPGEDFERYPRDLDHDLTLLAMHGADVVFLPSVEEMYPPGFSTRIDVGPIAAELEGVDRPGHFAGVATVVARLFGIVQPDTAYFGWKDAQQLLVIRRLVADLALPVEIVPVETVRDDDGLALSSRNAYLSHRERRAAASIPAALGDALAAYKAGERDRDNIVERALLALTGVQPLEVRYISLADLETLEELDTVDRPAILLLAAQVGQTRLIDNVRLADEE